MSTEDLSPADDDRLVLLDRIAERIPWLDLDQESIEWTTLEDGHEALLLNGGGMDGGEGSVLVNAGENLHAIGALSPIIDGYIGCVVIHPDGSRRLAHAVPDPLAPQPD